MEGIEYQEQTPDREDRRRLRAVRKMSCESASRSRPDERAVVRHVPRALSAREENDLFSNKVEPRRTPSLYKMGFSFCCVKEVLLWDFFRMSGRNFR